VPGARCERSFADPGNGLDAAVLGSLVPVGGHNFGEENVAPSIPADPTIDIDLSDRELGDLRISTKKVLLLERIPTEIKGLITLGDKIAR